eukprot:CAMPEP_0176411508 /NCGR_PEP_ID=MMETSP0127-20121128/3642_1 /TAXON_ID=938130 /ORGANISM="Platyophrya macrostoma, Strain WH" /LENGTH=152 /DNA_ID=CAMNT_0017791105 /DNA_START=168 /DNA_END=626 /DNA_ORIENTATION=+
MTYGTLLYPVLGLTTLAGLGYLLARSVEKIYLSSEFEAIDAAMKKEQQLIQNLPPKKALKFMPRVEAKKYEHLINLDKSGPEAYNKFEALTNEILAKSKKRVRAVTVFLGLSGLLHGLARSRVSFYNFSKAYEPELNNFDVPQSNDVTEKKV